MLIYVKVNELLIISFQHAKNLRWSDNCPLISLHAAKNFLASACIWSRSKAKLHNKTRFKRLVLQLAYLMIIMSRGAPCHLFWKILWKMCFFSYAKISTIEANRKEVSNHSRFQSIRNINLILLSISNHLC